jgi:hypothetical protein
MTLIALFVVTISAIALLFFIKKIKNKVPLRIWYRVYTNKNKNFKNIKYIVVASILLSTLIISFLLFIISILIIYIIYYFNIKEDKTLLSLKDVAISTTAIVNENWKNTIETNYHALQDIIEKDNYSTPISQDNFSKILIPS